MSLSLSSVVESLDVVSVSRMGLWEDSPPTRLLYILRLPLGGVDCR